MSLAKRNDGCSECRVRRVRCDKTEPECLKCRKKGLRCSGQGIECRFSKHMRRKQAAASAISDANASAPSSTTTTSSSSLKSSKVYFWVDSDSGEAKTPITAVDDIPSSRLASLSLEVPPSNVSGGRQEGEKLTKTTPVSPGVYQSLKRLPSPRGALEIVPPRSRMLFDHFSKSIASKMVVLDFNGNGYRQLILPLACQNDLVGQAVSVISAFHLAQKAPSMHMAAERGQQMILSRLRRQSLTLEPNAVFKISTWVTILVLLVGDTITGSNNYVYLLQLLSRLAQLSAHEPSLSDTTKSFQLFGFPLSSESKGVETLTKSPDYYLDFMTSNPSTSNPEHYSNVLLMKDVIRQACRIYHNRASHQATRKSSIEAVEKLHHTVVNLDPECEGSHALVWPFFVASAESILPEHRDFFYNRLKSLFQVTRFGSIPLALQILEYIWTKQDSTNWTEIVTHEKPILIM
ncbi:hypothetical protein QQS21_000084 [Conoideocrella luteorostrata]|uniref:Zn(2)-C6 fungal-type domain-containing protein n=1 Tax=Conoideocrella luteorostrata TaxID=1105319 RepID=A0AAJ0D1Q3_9HYPO|nr:hypothetical protein QQS21_000084 [Conoideocrella luteorostrata]